ncbi:HTH-type transcriptional regulator ymfC [Streptococcus pyogenes]|nr:HTH-type transcriptional regulator ymfC [Streptococcus pyogenes]VHG29640.1 HTH-type transcriptional regulator ymfC [Streptococcus pyogenes]
MTKYERIYKDLETKINKDFYKEGDFLPTEIELSQQSRYRPQGSLTSHKGRSYPQKTRTWHPSD